MIIYFTASVIGKRHYLSNYLAIVEYLKSKNFTVISDHIIKTTEREIRLEEREDRLKFHNKLEKWIKSSNFMVAETSFPSISVGYEISLALSYEKPVLLLYHEGDPPSLFAHHKDDKVLCEKYTLENLPHIIDHFIRYAQGTKESRFNFFLTSEISSFLKKVSKREKVPKSVYLRRLIEKEMKNQP